MHSQADESVTIVMQRSKDNIWTKSHHNSSVMGTQKILAEVALTHYNRSKGRFQKPGTISVTLKNEKRAT